MLGILEGAASSPTYEYLKRLDEGMRINDLHKTPRFVEDLIREAIAQAVSEFEEWPDEQELQLSVTNMESTFEYLLRAKTTTSLREARRALAAGSSLQAH